MKLKLFLISIPLLVLTMFIIVKHNKAWIISTYNEYRPILLEGGGEECLTDLKQIQTTYKTLGNAGSATCPILNAVRVTKYANTTLSSPFIVSCPTALNIGKWLEDIKAKSITHLGTVNCRSRRGSGLQSEHSFGIAIDITRIDEAVVKKDATKLERQPFFVFFLFCDVLVLLVLKWISREVRRPSLIIFHAS